MVRVVINNLAAQDLEIMGLIPLTDKGKPGGVAELGDDGKVPKHQLPPIAAETPTLEEIGAEPMGAEARARGYTDERIAQIPAPSLPTLAELGGEVAGASAQAIADHKRESDPHPQYVFDVELSSHTSSTNNPHQVTRAQLAAEPEGAEARAKAYTDQKISQIPPAPLPTPAQIGAEPAGAEGRAKSYVDQRISGLEYPSSHLHIWGYAVPPAGKSFTVTLNTGAELGRFANLNTTNNGDVIEYEALLKAGSYRLTITGQRNTTRGVSVIYVDGIYVGHYDWYNGGAIQRQAVTFDFNLATSGLHVIRVAASPSSGGSSLALSTIAINLLSGVKQITAPIRINAGATNNYTDPEGILWTKDLFGSGGSVYDPSYNGGIANTTKPTLYQSERSADAATFSYTIPVTVAGTYTVRLHFSENYYNNTQYSTRPLGTISINGSNVLNNFSIFNEAGGMYRALIKEFSNLNFTSQCTISFTNTLLNAVEVIKQ